MKKDMTTGSDWKLILFFTLPIIAGNLLQQLYNTVDGIVVGNFVGEYALSATGTCVPLVILFLAFSIGLGIGGGIMISQYFGAQKMEELRLASSTILIMMSIIGLFMSVLGLTLSAPLLKYVLNVPAENGILDMAVLYFRIYSLGLFFQFVYNAIAYMLRNIGDSKATLYFLAVSALLNVVLDLIFVAVFKWGVAGAAAATTISQACCAAVSYIYMVKKAPILSPEKNSGHFDKKMCLLTLRLGLPASIQHSIISCGHIAMQRLVNGFGSASMSAYTAAGMIDQFALIPIFGFNAGMATFAGQNVGAGNFQRVKTGMKKTQIMSLICCVIVITVLILFSPNIVRLFGLDGTALARSVEQVRYVAPWYLLFSVNLIIGGLLQGSGDVIFPMASSITSLVIRVLLGYAGVYLGLLSYNAAWAVLPVAWCFSLAINLSRYLSGAWMKKAITRKEPDNIQVTDE